MFTHDNTDGFSDADLAMMNEALAERIEAGEDEKSASNAINNAWFDGCTVEHLISGLAPGIDHRLARG